MTMINMKISHNDKQLKKKTTTATELCDYCKFKSVNYIFTVLLNKSTSLDPFSEPMETEAPK